MRARKKQSLTSYYYLFFVLLLFLDWCMSQWKNKSKTERHTDGWRYGEAVKFLYQINANEHLCYPIQIPKFSTNWCVFSQNYIHWSKLATIWLNGCMLCVCVYLFDCYAFDICSFYAHQTKTHMYSSNIHQWDIKERIRSSLFL